MSLNDNTNRKSYVPNVSHLTHSIFEKAKNLQEEEQELERNKQHLSDVTEKKLKEFQKLRASKEEIDAEIESLKLKDESYLKEHSELRNSIANVRFQIEKIKQQISDSKAEELKCLENFEKSIDEIAVKFRSSPDIYNRETLLAKLENEKKELETYEKNTTEIKGQYAAFCRDGGLREKSNANENILDLVLPGSALYHLIEMERNLDEVIKSMKTASADLEAEEMKSRKLDDEIASIKSELANLQK